MTGRRKTPSDDRAGDSTNLERTDPESDHVTDERDDGSVASDSASTESDDATVDSDLGNADSDDGCAASDHRNADSDDGSADSDHRNADGDDRNGAGPDLPEAVVDRVESVTRRAREAVDDREREAYRNRRDDLLAEHGYTARVREEPEGDVLVCHPEEWHDGEVIRTDRIEDLSRAVEVPLEGTDDPDEWESVEAHNRQVAERVTDEYGHPHGATAHALADFAGNHYAKAIAALTVDELEEFRTEYFVRNAWPSDEQVAELERSLSLIVDVAKNGVPVDR